MTTLAAGPSVRDDLAPPRSRARATLTGTLADLDPISLDEVLAAAGLQTRTDHKYLLTPEQLTELVDAVRSDSRVLQIDGRRAFGYESVYFDTPDLLLYRAHRQRRRRRYKVRSRAYLDSAACMFEVKVKGYRGQTVKHRLPYAFTQRHRMDATAQTFLSEVLGREYGVEAPALKPTLTTAYTRGTLVDASDGARLTCDVDLTYDADLTEGAAPRQWTGPDKVLVESKSTNGTARADLALKAMGIRPVALSKYCIGTALMHPHLPANPWNRLLRQQFGWTPTARS